MLFQIRKPSKLPFLKKRITNLQVQAADADGNLLTDTTENGVEIPVYEDPFIDNPDTVGEFVGNKILEENIIPALLAKMLQKKREENEAALAAEEEQAKAIVKAAAEVIT